MNIIKITRETRFDSWLQSGEATSKRARIILDTLGSGEMTARQIMVACGFTDLNAVRPRITELCHAGILEACGKAYDTQTKRNVAVFRRKDVEVNGK